MGQNRFMSLFSHPIKKLTLAAAFGIGYTLGAKAGRERYEQIKHTAQQVKDDPRVQQATSQAEDFVRETAAKVKDDPRVDDIVSRAEGIVNDAAGKAKHLASDVEDAVKDDDLADKAKGLVDDVKDKAADVADDAKDAAKDAKAKAEDAKAKADDKPLSPLLADEHVVTDEQVVYTTGPDLEETVDELVTGQDADDHRRP